MSDQLKFIVLEAGESVPVTGSNLVVLGYDNWDDWFELETAYQVFYYDADGFRTNLGSIKIGQHRQSSRRALLPREFLNLPNEAFSVGLSEDYYKSIVSTGQGPVILSALNDISFDLENFERYKDERVTKVSLFRSVDADRIQNKFHRLAMGDVELTRYSFEYVLDEGVGEDDGGVITFEVEPNSQPPSNIHTLIGRNGVGKTTFLNNLSKSYLDQLTTRGGVSRPIKNDRLRIYSARSGGSFANLISVTFSAFDPFFTETNTTKGRYSYIGLKESLPSDEKRSLPTGREISFRVKGPDDLTKDFIQSASKCLEPIKNKRWAAALKNLASDPIFEESEIIELTEVMEDLSFWTDEAVRVFRRLSSGHKIVLLTITKLVELVEEQSLVLLDEPESHLHPPLLSAFIRTLSELLTAQNGVAIVATHSPVVLQETPKKCAWILDRSGNSARARRPVAETFGENVGRLTHEVFGLEVTETGFYELLRKASSRSATYDSVLDSFDGQLGTEAQAILHALLPSKKARVR